ncbi:MAG: acyl-CoA thioesterase [Candidatus Dactylopiibacterium sp.]|nr:acyl-CoA thioesterase [Candidatus Dactylopiibacterium sp.]
MTALPRDEPVLRVLPLPKDLNAAGDVFGGWILSHIDLAGVVPAVRRARGRVVTLAVNGCTFRAPIFKSDLVSFYARLVREGTTSMTVEVEVYCERDPQSPFIVKVADASLTYVAIDDSGRKRPLPPQ